MHPVFYTIHINEAKAAIHKCEPGWYVTPVGLGAVKSAGPFESEAEADLAKLTFEFMLA